MAKDYPNPPPAGSKTLLPFHDAASDQNLSILQTRLDVAKAVEKRTANYLRIAEDDDDADLVRYFMHKLAEQKLKVSRCETRIARERVASLVREVSYLHSLLAHHPSERRDGLEEIQQFLRNAGV